MALDTATLAAIATTTAVQIKDEVLGGIQEAVANIDARDRKAIVAAVEAISLLAARQYAGDKSVAAELEQWKSVIASYQDVAALIAKRVTRERLQAIAADVGGAALQAAETIVKGLVVL